MNILQNVRLARWLMGAAHVPIVAIAPIFTILGSPATPASGQVLIPLLLAVVLGAIQWRHSLATARGVRPRHGTWTLATMAALVYLPMLWFGWPWISSQILLVASLPMVVRGRLAAIAAGLPIAGSAAAYGLLGWSQWHSIVGVIYGLLYGGLITGVTALALYGSARLVRVVRELRSARAELADLAVSSERLRVSRDLHDLLGQSLSAVSLKGDLALRLLPSDVHAARTEIESLTELARGALHDMRAITRDEHTVSLRAEAGGAAALLRAAGVQARIEVDSLDLSSPVEEVLAWAVREGVANLLRHSAASTCAITAAVRNGSLRLEIVNDGVRTPAGVGNGLAGLTERARAVSGSVITERTADGQFRLLVEIPEEAP